MEIDKDTENTEILQNGSQCKICKQNFKKREQMLHHMRKKHPECDLPKRRVNYKRYDDLKCRQCSQTFHNTGPYRLHLQRHIKDISEPCHQCYDNIRKPAKMPSLVDHGNNVHSCEKCDNKYCHDVYLEIHEATHKLENICPKCDKTFIFKADFDRHLLVHSDVRNFRCEICQAAFKEAKKLRRHENSVHGNIKAKCLKCDRVYSCRESLQKHLASSHENAQIYRCTKCPRQFQSQKSLRDHIGLVHENKMHECNLCNKKYSYKDNLNRHIAMFHHKRRIISCTQCDKTFQDKSSLMRHQQRQHMLDQDKKHVCQMCHKEYLTKDSLRYHMQQMHNQQMEKYKCSVCGKILSCKNTLQTHIAIKHSNTERQRVKCPHCNNTYATKDGLYEHMNTKHLHPDEKHYCKTCKKHFASKYTLKKHLRRQHLYPKVYKCSVCTHICHSETGLKLHMDHQHVNPKQQYTCRICFRVYKYESELKWHMKEKNHFESLEGSVTFMKPRVYPCNFCSYTSLSHKGLKLHTEREHTNSPQQFPCRLCSKIFKHHSGLKQHMDHQHINPDKKFTFFFFFSSQKLQF